MAFRVVPLFCYGIRQRITEYQIAICAQLNGLLCAYWHWQVLNEVRSIEKSIIRVCYKRLWHGWSRQSTGHSAVYESMEVTNLLEMNTEEDIATVDIDFVVEDIRNKINYV